MDKLIDRLKKIEHFSDQMCAARTENDADLILKLRQERKEIVSSFETILEEIEEIRSILTLHIIRQILGQKVIDLLMSKLQIMEDAIKKGVIMFALKHKKTGKYLGVNTFADGEEESADVNVALSLKSKSIWVVKDKEVAEKASENSPPWYEATYEEPENDFVGEVEVVELTEK